jgi:hypothetical protein
MRRVSHERRENQDRRAPMKLLKWIIKMGGTKADFARGMREEGERAERCGQRLAKWIRRTLWVWPWPP